MYPSDLSIIYCYQKCRCNLHDFESFSRSETNVALVFCVQMWTNSTERILLDSIICANLDGKIVHIQLILSVSVNFAEKNIYTTFSSSSCLPLPLQNFSSE